MRYGFGPGKGLAVLFFFLLVFAAGGLLDAKASELTRLADVSRIILDRDEKKASNVRTTSVAARRAGFHFERRSDTTLSRRWGMSRPRVEAETDWLASCASGACRDRRVEPWMKVIAVLRAVPKKSRPALVQTLLSRRIDYVSDRVIDDHWANPLATLLSGAGDCEDHALLKRAILMASGFSDAEVPLLVLETPEGQGHMALLVSSTDQMLVLDNRLRAAVPLSLLSNDKVVAFASRAGYFVAQ